MTQRAEPSPSSKTLQGTYLAAGVQKDLDNMIDHLEPAAAVATIRDLNKALYDNRRQVLGSSSANLRVCASFWFIVSRLGRRVGPSRASLFERSSQPSGFC